MQGSTYWVLIFWSRTKLPVHKRQIGKLRDKGRSQQWINSFNKFISQETISQDPANSFPDKGGSQQKTNTRKSVGGGRNARIHLLGSYKFIYGSGIESGRLAKIVIATV